MDRVVLSAGRDAFASLPRYLWCWLEVLGFGGEVEIFVVFVILIVVVEVAEAGGERGCGQYGGRSGLDRKSVV